MRRDIIEKPDPSIPDGAVVELFEGERFLARGFYNSKSQLVIRLLSWRPDENIDDEFFKSKIRSAIELRKSFRILEKTNSVRWIFGEADGLPGLVADQFDDSLVLQVTSLGLYQRLSAIVQILQELLRDQATPPKRVLLKEEKSHWEKEGIEEAGSRWLIGDPKDSLKVIEGGIQYQIHIRDAHKTGFYLDQRDNRRKLREMSAGKRVLDLCCYTGGFALHAAAGGAESVLGLDSSGPAILQARENLRLNSFGNSSVDFVEADFTNWAKANSDQYDIVVLDPPKLIPGQKFMKQGLRTYYFYNELGLEKVRPGGYLWTFSCSGSLGREEFQSVLASVARRRGYSLQMVDQLSAPADHPVLLSAPNSQYLKGFVFRVTKAF